MFDRKELHELEQRAKEAAEAVINPGWKKAYENLAWACNVLDAFMGRSTVNE